MNMTECPFCKIVNGTGEVSKVFEDDSVLALIPLKPIHPGECMVIPKDHIDHFTDIPDALAAHIMVIGQRVGRKIMEVYQPLRIGMVVHGFGVAHAHLMIVPQYDPFDITSKMVAVVEDGEIKFDPKVLPDYSRADLDEIARKIRF